jgi:hypothetical protein
MPRTLPVFLGGVEKMINQGMIRKILDRYCRRVAPVWSMRVKVMIGRKDEKLS